MPAIVLAICMLVSSAAMAQTTISAGHTVLTLPADMRAYSAALARKFTGGDPVRIERQVVSLAHGTHPPVSVLLIRSTREAGRYIWRESCKQMRNDAHTFVHSPFHAMGNECTFVVGPLDLARVIADSFPDIEVTLRAGEQTPIEGMGYVIESTYAASSGSMLSVTAFVQEPFARLQASSAAPEDTGVPASVVAWARSLNEQVRSAMRSFSGEWRLPPLEGKADD